MMVQQSNSRFAVGKVKLYHHLFLAGLIRAVLIAFGEWQDQHFHVKYTDVDYHVFTDGASYVANGRSPFLRDTYRYSPLLAVLLVPNILLHPSFGKALFSVADVLVGYYLHHIVRTARFSERKAVLCTCLWLYNPITLAVSTRGNADSLLSVLVVFALFAVLKNRDTVAGLAYGLSVHLKMYTAVYALPFYLALQTRPLSGSTKGDSETLRSYLSRLLLPNRRKMLFVGACAASCLVPSLGSYLAYGTEYVQEAFVYHVTRKDVRHNFSPLFYSLYLAEEEGMPMSTAAAFLPQLLLMAMVSFKYGQLNDLPFALFCETFILVGFNKVVTSQYFLWYLCLLPAALPKLNLSLRNGILLLFMWLGGQALWLAEAYYLEFAGKPLFLHVWVASLIFLVANTFVLCYMMTCYSGATQKTKKAKNK